MSCMTRDAFIALLITRELEQTDKIIFKIYQGRIYWGCREQGGGGGGGRGGGGGALSDPFLESNYK
jgi:hypothetical protein